MLLRDFYGAKQKKHREIVICEKFISIRLFIYFFLTVFMILILKVILYTVSYIVFRKPNQESLDCNALMSFL